MKVLAATNRDVDQLVREQRFRNDLFFRLNVLRLEMLPLRERRGDIPILAQHFLDRLCAQPGTQRKTLAPASMTKLSRMDWPGNVRELSNVIQSAFVFAEGLQILLCVSVSPCDSSDALGFARRGVTSLPGIRTAAMDYGSRARPLQQA